MLKEMLAPGLPCIAHGVRGAECGRGGRERRGLVGFRREVSPTGRRPWLGLAAAIGDPRLHQLPTPLEQIASLVVGFGRVRHDVGECGLRDLARECAPGAQREREGGLALRPGPQRLDERDRVLEAFL